MEVQTSRREGGNGILHTHTHKRKRERETDLNKGKDKFPRNKDFELKGLIKCQTEKIKTHPVSLQ